jgi:surface antigen
LAKVAQFCSKKTIFGAKEQVANFLVGIRDFFVAGKYVPHIVVVVLALIVTAVNVNQRYIAEAFSSDIVAAGPDVQYSVTSSVDAYTPLIKDDGQVMQDAIVLAANTTGFATSSGSITTEITERTKQNTPAAELPDNTSQTIEYSVKNGDTLSGIGMLFNVKVSTIQYLNDISNADMLKPGSTIKIPKKGYEVSASAIAKKAADKKAAQLAAAARNTVTRNSSTSRATGSAPASIKAPAGSKINGYPYGYCTYYVATRRAVPSSWGDAKQWLGSAQRAGYSTGSQPVAGAIVVTTESWWGHVAYVESTDGDTITIAEMNARGWGVVSRRTLSAHGGVVRGYIY